MRFARLNDSSFLVWARIAMPSVALLLLIAKGGTPLQAQTNRIQQAAEVIYAELPNFPSENTYVSGDGAEPQNTLIRRMLAYHIHTQGRSPRSRLDWKLTLADYLDLNEPMYAGVYPSANVLTVNPHQRDREIVQNLSREEREALLLAIFKAFDVDVNFQSLDLAGSAEVEPSTSEDTPTAVDSELEQSPRLPARGSADQLL